jgi:hypothetical protein
MAAESLNFESFANEVNQALQHFAPVWLGGNYKGNDSYYFYKKGDLRITYFGCHPGYAQVMWKECQYKKPAIWSAIAEWWLENKDAVTAKTGDKSQVEFNVHSQDLWAELFRERHGKYPHP